MVLFFCSDRFFSGHPLCPSSQRLKLHSDMESIPNFAEGISAATALSVIFSKIGFYLTRQEKNGELSQVLWSNKTWPTPLVQLG